MRASDTGLSAYLSEVAELMERFGIVLAEDELVIGEGPDGHRTFALRGFLPEGRRPPRSILELRERWRPVGADAFERAEYAYELLDRERSVRRAFHLHDADVFVRRFQVVVHEHCEQPIGRSVCDHHEGSPVKDGFAAVLLLVDAWTGDRPDCSALPCLESG